MPRPASTTDIMATRHQPIPADNQHRQPANLRTPDELSAILFGRRPPGDAPDPRAGSRKRTGG